jgi:hypothetical protein
MNFTVMANEEALLFESGAAQADAEQLFNCAPNLGAQTGQSARQACSSSAEPRAHCSIPAGPLVLCCLQWHCQRPDGAHGS